jgi:hypothetical protein
LRDLKFPLAAGLAMWLACGAAWADTLKFTAALEPEKAGAAKGTASLTVDTGSKKLDWSIAYSGLSAPPAMAAILSPPPDAESDPGTLPQRFRPSRRARLVGRCSSQMTRSPGSKPGNGW